MEYEEKVFKMTRLGLVYRLSLASLGRPGFDKNGTS